MLITFLGQGGGVDEVLKLSSEVCEDRALSA